jgi:hypothetical protein
MLPEPISRSLSHENRIHTFAAALAAAVTQKYGSFFTLGKQSMDVTSLNHLHAITLELDNEGLLDCVDRHDETILISETHQNSLYAPEDSIRNPDALANFEVRMRSVRNSIPEQEPYGSQLDVRYQRCSSSVPDKADNSNFAKNLGLLGRKLRNADKDITRKEREIDRFSPITPLARLLNCREISIKTICLESNGDDFLVPGLGANGAPRLLTRMNKRV